MIVGEAAVALVLETAESVQRRNVRPLARLAGINSSGSAIRPAGFHEVAAGVQRV